MEGRLELHLASTNHEAPQETLPSDTAYFHTSLRCLRGNLRLNMDKIQDPISHRIILPPRFPAPQNGITLPSGKKMTIFTPGPQRPEQAPAYLSNFTTLSSLTHLSFFVPQIHQAQSLPTACAPVVPSASSALWLFLLFPPQLLKEAEVPYLTQLPDHLVTFALFYLLLMICSWYTEDAN